MTCVALWLLVLRAYQIVHSSSGPPLQIYVDAGSSGVRAQVFVLRNTKGRALLAQGQQCQLTTEGLSLKHGFKLGSLVGKIRVTNPRDENGAPLPQNIVDYCDLFEKQPKQLLRYLQLFTDAIKEKICPVCFRPRCVDWCLNPGGSVEHQDSNCTDLDIEQNVLCTGGRFTFYATAGMRQLHMSHGSQKVGSFFDFIKQALVHFMPHTLLVSIEVIDGTQEALFSWVEANLLAATRYADQPLLPPPEESLIIMEMGGISSQVAMPILDEEDNNMFHRALKDAQRVSSRVKHLMSAISSMSISQPIAYLDLASDSLRAGTRLQRNGHFDLATFSLLSTTKGKLRLNCCEEPGLGCVLGELSPRRTAQQCTTYRTHKSTVGGLINTIVHILNLTAVTMTMPSIQLQCSSNLHKTCVDVAQWPWSGQNEVLLPMDSLCLSSSIELRGVRVESASSNGSNCDKSVQALIEADPNVHGFGKFIKFYVNKYVRRKTNQVVDRPRRTIAFGDFALIGKLGLGYAYSTLAQMRTWAMQIIDIGAAACMPGSLTLRDHALEDVRNRLCNSNLGGIMPVALLLLYHLLVTAFGYDEHADLTPTGARFADSEALRPMIEPVDTVETWPDSGMGKWELSWNLGACFLEHHHAPMQ